MSLNFCLPDIFALSHTHVKKSPPVSAFSVQVSHSFLLISLWKQMEHKHTSSKADFQNASADVFFLVFSLSPHGTAAQALITTTWRCFSFQNSPQNVGWRRNEVNTPAVVFAQVPSGFVSCCRTNRWSRCCASFVCFILFELGLRAVVCVSGLDSARHTLMQNTGLNRHLCSLWSCLCCRTS